eukprot:385268_1
MEQCLLYLTMIKRGKQNRNYTLIMGNKLSLNVKENILFQHVNKLNRFFCLICYMSSLSETAIYSLRHKNKASISKYFYQYVNSKLFLNTVEKLKLNRYSFIIAEERHCSQILDLICYQFSRLGRSPDRILFDWSISDITTLYEIKIKHAIKCGSMIL